MGVATTTCTTLRRRYVTEASIVTRKIWKSYDTISNSKAGGLRIDLLDRETFLEWMERIMRRFDDLKQTRLPTYPNVR